MTSIMPVAMVGQFAGGAGSLGCLPFVVPLGAAAVLPAAPTIGWLAPGVPPAPAALATVGSMRVVAPGFPALPPDQALPRLMAGSLRAGVPPELPATTGLMVLGSASIPAPPDCESTGGSAQALATRVSKNAPALRARPSVC